MDELTVIEQSELSRLGTFDRYCKERWDFGRNYAYKLIASATTAKNLCTTVHISERKLRPLTHVEPEQQQEVWQEAVETAPEGDE